jgi:hypothetical protein
VIDEFRGESRILFDLTATFTGPVCKQPGVETMRKAPNISEAELMAEVERQAKAVGLATDRDSAAAVADSRFKSGPAGRPRGRAVGKGIAQPNEARNHPLGAC